MLILIIEHSDTLQAELSQAELSAIVKKLVQTQTAAMPTRNHWAALEKCGEGVSHSLTVCQ